MIASLFCLLFALCIFIGMIIGDIAAISALVSSHLPTLTAMAAGLGIVAGNLLCLMYVYMFVATAGETYGT